MKNINNILIVLFSIFTVVFCYYFENILISSILLLGLIIYGIISNKANIFSPILWFIPFIYLYHQVVIFRDLLGVGSTYCKQEIVFSTALAVVTSLIIFTLFLSKQSIRKIKFNNNLNIKSLGKIEKLFLILTILSLILYIKSGVTSKSEANLSGNFEISIFLFRIYILLNIALLIKKLLYNNYKRIKINIIFNISYLLLSALITGERDILFFYILALIMTFFYFRVIKNYHLVIIISISIFLIPIMGEYKNILYKDIKQSEKISSSIFIDLITKGEFLSAGRNLETILLNERELKYGVSLLNDIERGLIPGFIKKSNNSVKWFANKYHYDALMKGSGYGFSIIAEGYINFHYWGIVIWFLIISTIIVILHNRAGITTYYLLFYILSISSFIYALRGDFSSVLSPLLKQILIPIIFIRFMSNEKNISNRRG